MITQGSLRLCRRQHDEPPEPKRPQPFTSVTTSQLVDIIKGELDPIDEAAFELNARCRDLKGSFIGPKASGIAYKQFKKTREGK